MEKQLIFIFSLLSLLLFGKCLKRDEEDLSYDEYSNKYFKDFLREYLMEHKLYKSKRLVNPAELKNIFIEVITQGEPDTSGLYKNLADYFVDKYYKENKEIKAKDIFKLFDIHEISQKFEQLMAENPDLNPYGYGKEEEDDYDYDDGYDSRDYIGDPSEDI